MDNDLKKYKIRHNLKLMTVRPVRDAEVNDFNIVRSRNLL